MSDSRTICTDYLKMEVFGHSSVMSTLQDSHAKGFDTSLLKDACATDSPEYAQESAEYNCCRNWGFLSICRALNEAVISL